MSQQEPLIVVVFKSFSYSGTTWANCVLGSHEKALALGPPDALLKNWSQKNFNKNSCCQIHKQDCPLWEKLPVSHAGKKPLFQSLYEISGKSVFVLNNPTPELIKDHLNQTQMKTIYWMRDLRAICASAMRHNKNFNFLFTVIGWLFPALMVIPTPTENDCLFFTYEKALDDKSALLKTCGDFLNLDYQNHAFRFWEFNHHLVAGNQAITSLLRHHQDLESLNKLNEFYQKVIPSQLQSASGDFVDNRWKTAFDDYQLFVMNLFLGDYNQQWGYQRDHFSKTEQDSFFKKLKEDLETEPSNVQKAAQNYLKTIR